MIGECCCLDKRRVIYYTDELSDEFSTAKIKARPIDRNYRYDRNPAACFFWYRMIATLPAILYVKIALHQKTADTEGRKALKAFKKRGEGCYMYGNHTQATGDPLTPNVFCLPKRVSFVVHANNVSMPVLGAINPYLGAIPLPDDSEAFRNFSACIKGRIERGDALIIYPEAHIWPYYTGIRPFPDMSFGYPARSGAAVFCFTNTYKKRGGLRKPAQVTYIDGPFYPDTDLPLKERTRKLRDQIYRTMCERAKLSDAEPIKYIKIDKNAKEQEGE